MTEEESAFASLTDEHKARLQASSVNVNHIPVPNAHDIGHQGVYSFGLVVLYIITCTI